MKCKREASKLLVLLKLILMELLQQNAVDTTRGHLRSHVLYHRIMPMIFLDDTE